MQTEPCRAKSLLVIWLFFILYSTTSFSLSTLSLCRWKKLWEKRRQKRGRLKRTRLREKLRGGGWEFGFLSAVVIKACALKRGQSIQPSASTSHQASWRRLKMSCLVQAASLGRWERESFSKESIITAAEDRKVLKVWAAVRVQRKMTDPLLIAVFTATEFLDSIVYFKENRWNAVWEKSKSWNNEKIWKD